MPGLNPSWVSVFSSTMPSSVALVRITPFDRPVDPLVKITAMGSSGARSILKSSGGSIPLGVHDAEVQNSEVPTTGAGLFRCRQVCRAGHDETQSGVIGDLANLAALSRAFSGTSTAPDLTIASAATGHSSEFEPSSPTRSPGLTPSSVSRRASLLDQSCSSRYVNRSSATMRAVCSPLVLAHQLS